jgi:SagB-type dehydrogenase family enzyme
VYERTTGKYGQRGTRYVHIEVGNASQNIYLQAVSLNLGTVLIGAFDDGKVKKVLNMQNTEQPLSIMPVGKN